MTPPAGRSRDQDEVLADAIRVLTEAARLRRPVLRQAEGGGWEPHPLQSEPADWAEFITLAVAGAAANIGSIDRALEGRPGSWEADAVRSLLLSTVGENPAELLRHRTEPIRVVLRPAEILADLGHCELYDESRQVLQAGQHRHMWRYRLSEDRTWTPLDPGAPAWACTSGVPASPAEPDHTLLRAGSVSMVPRSAEDEAAYDLIGPAANMIFIEQIIRAEKVVLISNFPPRVGSAFVDELEALREAGFTLRVCKSGIFAAPPGWKP